MALSWRSALFLTVLFTWSCTRESPNTTGGEVHQTWLVREGLAPVATVDAVYVRWEHWAWSRVACVQLEDVRMGHRVLVFSGCGEALTVTATNRWVTQPLEAR